MGWGRIVVSACLARVRCADRDSVMSTSALAPNRGPHAIACVARVGEQAPGGDATKKCAAADGFAFTRKWILSLLRGGREVETHHLCKHASRGRSGLDDYEGCLCFTRACCRDVTSGALTWGREFCLRLCGRTFPKVDRRILEIIGRS